MSVEQIRKIAASLSKLVEDNEKIALPLFSVKLTKAAKSYPEDQTIGIMSDVVSRMSNLFITRSEIKDMYNRLYTRNTKFAEVFKEELGEIKKVASPQTYNRDGNDENYDLIKEAYEKVVDPTFSAALNSAFGNETKPFTSKMESIATKTCSDYMTSLGTKPNSVVVASGNSELLLCVVAFETPKGTTNVYVPVEFAENKALIPSVFVGNDGSAELNKENLTDYIVSSAGAKLKLNESIVLKAAMSAKSHNEEISNVDMALIKLNATKEASTQIDTNSVVFQAVNPEPKNVAVSVPTYKDSEVESFATALNSAAGVAAFTHSKEKVNSGRVVIARELKNFGYKNVQIATADCDKDTIVYAVSINDGRVGFKVPLKVSDLSPTVLISNGTVLTFDEEGINSLLKSDVSDSRALAAASPLHDLKPSDLIEIVRSAVAEKNFAKAEDALNILATKNDEKAYKVAFVAYSDGLTEKVVVASKCKMPSKNAHSQHILCGHTNLPLSKVYQDKNGDCHPLYRKGMDESYEGAYFMNSKIFF